MSGKKKHWDTPTIRQIRIKRETGTIPKPQPFEKKS